MSRIDMIAPSTTTPATIRTLLSSLSEYSGAAPVWVWVSVTRQRYWLRLTTSNRFRGGLRHPHGWSGRTPTGGGAGNSLSVRGVTVPVPAAERGQRGDCWMSFVPVTGPARLLAGEPPREGSVEFTDERRTIVMPIRGALPVLGKARDQADVHPSVALLAGAALLGLQLVASGRFAPDPEGRHWQVAGL